MLTYVVLFAVEHQTEDGVPEEGRETDDEISVACARWCSCWPGRMCCRNCYLDKQHYVRFINFVDWLTMSLLSKSARLFNFFRDSRTSRVRIRVMRSWVQFAARRKDGGYVVKYRSFANPQHRLQESYTGYKKATSYCNVLDYLSLVKIRYRSDFYLVFFYVSYIKWYLFKKDPS